MRRRHNRSVVQVAAISPRHFVGGLALVLLVLASLSLIIISHTSPDSRARISAPIVDSASPVLDVLSRPADSFNDFTGWIQSLVHIHAQNADLRRANARLMQWQHVALRLEAENAALRELVHYSSQEQLKFTTAKVISDRSGPFTRTALINAGASLGIEAGQPVINGDGLVGRVIETGDHSAHVLLLTDINSRIPVITEHSRERSIAGGNNTDLLDLMYLAEDTRIQIGEKIFTSGDGNTIPAGLPVGEVIGIENGQAQVRPYADWFRLEYVSAIRPEQP